MSDSVNRSRLLAAVPATISVPAAPQANEPTAKERAAQALAPHAAQAEAMAPAMAACGASVAAYYQKLVEGGVPEQLATDLTMEFSDRLMNMLDAAAADAREGRAVAQRIAGS